VQHGVGVSQAQVTAVGRRLAVVLETGEQHTRGFNPTCFGRTAGFQAAMERFAGFVRTTKLAIIRQTALVRQTRVQCTAPKFGAFVFGTAVVNARCIHIVRMPGAHFTTRRGLVAILLQAGTQRVTRLLGAGVFTSTLHDTIFIKLARRLVALLPTGGRFRTLFGQARLKRLMGLGATHFRTAARLDALPEQPGRVVFTLLATGGRLIALIRNTVLERLLCNPCTGVRPATVGDTVLERLVRLNEARLFAIRRRITDVDTDGACPLGRSRSTNGTLRRLDRLH